MNSALRTVMVASLVLAIGGCKKTEKGESQRWDSALSTAAQLQATYPGFKDAIAEQRAAAEKAMTAAKQVEDKKKRIDAMSSANRLLTGGFIGKLRDADAEIKKVRGQLVELTGDVGTDAEKAALREAKRQAETSLREIKTALDRGAKTAAEAEAVMNKVSSDLAFATKTVASVSKRVTDRKSDKAAADKAATDKAAADKKAAEDAVANWTCSYCDHSNVHDATKCANCGADKSPK